MGNTFIEINGKRYDARSGELLGAGAQVSKPKSQSLQRRGRAMDGIVKPTAYSTQVAINHTAVNAVATLSPEGKVLEPVMAKRHRTASKVAQPHQPEKAKTLMRHAVSKPKPALKKSIKAQAPSEIAAAPVTALTPSLKKAAHNIDEHRLARARHTNRSQHVRRFTTVQQNHPVARTHALRSTDTQATTPNPTPRDVAGSTQSNAVKTTPGHTTPHDTRPPHSQHHTPRAKSTDLFEAAIANARAHEQPRRKPARKTHQKLLNATAGIAAFLLIAGFISYLNMPKIELRVASMRAGFSAELPGYMPTGYAREDIQAERGVVAATYRSGSNLYTLQQQTSDWDSQTLYDNVVAMADQESKTLSDQGRTVYVYGNNAAWVNGGILYSMKTAGDISNDEILSIATSM